MKDYANYSYPITNTVAKLFKCTDDLSNTSLVCCQHFLEPQKEMFRLFIEFGIKPENIFITGKIYSYNADIAKEMREWGIKVIDLEFTAEPFDIQHVRNCNKMLDFVPDKKEVIILDDGAEVINLVIERNMENVRFAVEQTSSGFRKLENYTLPFPVVNVARSKLKLESESIYIAIDCLESMELYFQKYNLRNPKILIVGLGPIGLALSNLLKEKGFSVSGLDKSIEDRDLVDEINKTQPDVVIGATGSNILSAKELERVSVAGILYLMSISSSDREFPVSAYRSGEGHHEDVVHKNIIFSNNGFPITFLGLRNEMPPQDIEQTMAQMLGSILHGIENEYLDNGLIDVPEQVQETVSKMI